MTGKHTHPHAFRHGFAVTYIRRGGMFTDCRGCSVPLDHGMPAAQCGQSSGEVFEVAGDPGSPQAGSFGSVRRRSPPCLPATGATSRTSTVSSRSWGVLHDIRCAITALRRQTLWQRHPLVERSVAAIFASLVWTVGTPLSGQQSSAPSTGDPPRFEVKSCRPRQFCVSAKGGWNSRPHGDAVPDASRAAARPFQARRAYRDT